MAGELWREFLERSLGRNAEADQRKQAWSDEYRKSVIAQYMGTANNLQKSLALMLNPDTLQPLPGKEQQVTQLRQQLGQVDDYIRKLYNPSFNPDSGKIYEDPLHKLTDKLHITKAPKENATASEQMQALSGIQQKFGHGAAAGIEQQEQDKKIEHIRGLLKKYGASDEVINATTAAIVGGYKPSPQKQQWDLLQGTVDGKSVSWLKDRYSGTITDLDGNTIPADQLAKFVSASKGAAPPKIGSLGEFLTNLYGPHPTAQQEQEGKRLWAAASASDTVGMRTILVPQQDGSIKALQVETTSKKVFPGSGTPVSKQGEPKKEKTAANQLKDLTAIRAKHSGVQSGDVVGGRRTATQNKADTDYVEAVKLASIADQVSAKPNDAINQKRLAVALERVSAGRFTTQALDYIIKAGWGNTIEQWANNPTTGALPADVLRQLVDGARENLKAAKDARDAAFNEQQGSPKRKVSIAKAMSLPQNAGKTRDQVKADIESHGYEPID